MADSGPYNSERQARAAAHAVVPPEDGWSILRDPQNRRLLGLACEAAGVELGAYDERILDWISGFEDSACAVFAGLIRRAYEAGKAAALDGAVTEWGVRYTDPDGSVREVANRNEARARHWAEPNPDPWGPPVETALIQRSVGPWIPAPGEDEDRG